MTLRFNAFLLAVVLFSSADSTPTIAQSNIGRMEPLEQRRTSYSFYPPVTYYCWTIYKNGALEAGPSFDLTKSGLNVTIESNTLETCEGTLINLPLDKFTSAEMAGKHCASDGFTIELDNFLVQHERNGLLKVPTNDPSDMYLCKRRPR